MPFDRVKARAAGIASGLSPEAGEAQIDAYLVSSRAQADSAAGTVPPGAPPPGGGDPLGAALGMGASAYDAVGGIKGLAAMAGGGYALKRFFDGRRSPLPPDAPPGAPPPPGPPPVRPAAPRTASLAEVTQGDIDAFPALRSFKPGEQIRRATLEKIKLDAAKVPPSAPPGPPTAAQRAAGGWTPEGFKAKRAADNAAGGRTSSNKPAAKSPPGAPDLKVVPNQILAIDRDRSEE